MNSYNGLAPAQAERLALLAEECGECVQAIGKVLRHGFDSCSPYDPKRIDNRAALVRECGDVLAAIEIIARAGDIILRDVTSARDDKMKRVAQFMHEQGHI